MLILLCAFRYVLNKFCRQNPNDDVEWGYAFDVHLNAFFPPLILLHFCQLFFYNGKRFNENNKRKLNLMFVLGLIGHEWFVSRFLGNTFWLIAVCYYIYITFLGYSSLGFLQRTQFILLPLPIMFIIYLATLILGYNITHNLMIFYRDRVL